MMVVCEENGQGADYGCSEGTGAIAVSHHQPHMASFPALTVDGITLDFGTNG